MKLLKSAEAAQKVNVSYDYFNRKVKYQPTFPKPVKVTPKAHPQWRDTDIDNWLKTA